MATDMRGFGYTVAFAEHTSGDPGLANPVIAEYRNTASSEPISSKGAVLLYGWRYPSSDFPR